MTTNNSSNIEFLKKDFELIHNDLMSIGSYLAGKPVLITGSTGFLGKWILYSLEYINQTKLNSFKIYAFSRSPDKFLNEHPDLKNQVWLHWLSLDEIEKAITIGCKINFNLDYSIKK